MNVLQNNVKVKAPGRAGKKAVEFDKRLKRMLRFPFFIFGIIVILFFLLVVVFGPVLTPYDPALPNPGYTLGEPTSDFLFGTDKFGRDVLTRVIYATRLDLMIALFVAVLSFSVGSLIGGIVGYYGGWLDKIVMRIVDVMFAFPSFILAMAITSALGDTVENVIIAIATAYTPYFIRLTRGEMLTVRTRQYADAAVSVGNPKWRVALVHLLPNSLTPSLVQMTLVSGWAILDAAGLAFLGLGITPPTAEWGVMVSEGAQRIITGEWWVWLYPGAAIVLAAFAFNLVGDGLRDVLTREEQ
ncbi:MAG: ABC transporter permease [Chloroflexi bacterium]|nr:MAG: ABC transporter permease [Chloroflexota bacterium]